ncbi:MAG: aminoacyl-tRNA hydrolase [Planctomycetota bacterium]|nr:MAG: aminoacyl-tRNA hydrolase [Planctomycetota bacterium]
MIDIGGGIFIPEDKIEFKFSRSGGPGGQNVNKVNTRVTLLFDVAGCESFSGEQKKQILRRLATRANRNGVLRVVCQRYRTQRANREAAVERLGELLREALKKKTVRKKTKVPKYAREKRLEEKKKRSMLKKQRAFSIDD